MNLDLLYRIKTYRYGLPDAGRAYYLAYSKALIGAGYKQAKSDPCLFVRIVKKENIRTLVWIHVDDSPVASTHAEELDRFKEIISKSFPLTCYYDITLHLGISITKFPDGITKLTLPKLLLK